VLHHCCYILHRSMPITIIANAHRLQVIWKKILNHSHHCNL
jgi:hypothetical protein